MTRNFLSGFVLVACLLPLGCDRATSSTPESPKETGVDSSALLRGGWVRIDTGSGAVQTMRLEANGSGRQAEWDSGARASQVRFAWSLQQGLLVRAVDSGSLRFPSTEWKLRSDTLVLGTGAGQKWRRSNDPETKARTASLELATRPGVDTGRSGDDNPTDTGRSTDTSSSGMAIADAAGMANLWMAIFEENVEGKVAFLDLRNPIAKIYHLEPEYSRLRCDTIGLWSVSPQGDVSLGGGTDSMRFLLRNDTAFIAASRRPYMRTVSVLLDLPIVPGKGLSSEEPVDTTSGCIPGGRDARLLGAWVPAKPDPGFSVEFQFRANGTILLDVTLNGERGSPMTALWGTRRDSLFIQMEGVEACNPGGVFKIVGDTLLLVGEDSTEVYVRPGSVVAPETLSCAGMTVLPELVGTWSMVLTDSLMAAAGVKVRLDLNSDGGLRMDVTVPEGETTENTVQEGIWRAGGGRILMVDPTVPDGTCEDAVTYTLVGTVLTIDELTFQRIEFDP